MYQANGNKIFYVSGGDADEQAVCEFAETAVLLLNKSVSLNNSHKYTASARMMYRAEQLPGFNWLHLSDNPITS